MNNQQSHDEHDSSVSDFLVAVEADDQAWLQQQIAASNRPSKPAQGAPRPH